MRSVAMTLAAIGAALSIASAAAGVQKVKPKPTNDPAVTTTPAPPSPQPTPYSNRQGSGEGVHINKGQLTGRKAGGSHPGSGLTSRQRKVQGFTPGLLDQQGEGFGARGPASAGTPAAKSPGTAPAGRLY